MQVIESINSILIWIIASSIKASVVVLLVLLLQFLLQRFLSARWRYALWYLVIIRLILPFNVESKWSVYNLINEKDNLNFIIGNSQIPEITDENLIEPRVEKTAINDAPSIINHQTSYQINSPAQNAATSFFSMQSILTIVWLIGIVFFLFSMFRKYSGLQNILKNASELSDSSLLKLLKDCQKKLKISHQFEILTVTQIQTPLLYYGFLRPKILLPDHLIKTFSLAQWEAIFMHELGHDKRKDIIMAWFTTFLLIFHWFNPLIWLAFYRMRVDRELACDEFTLSILGAEKAKLYGQTIIALLENFKSKYQMALTIGILENSKALKRRMIMIKNFRSYSGWLSIFALLLLVVSGFVTLSGATGMKRENKPYCKELTILMLGNSFIKVEGKNLPIESLAKFLDEYRFDDNSIIALIPDANMTMNDYIGLHQQLKFNQEFKAKIKYKNIKTGNPVILPVYNFNLLGMPEPKNLKPVNVNGKYSYIRTRRGQPGETVISPQFEDAQIFHEGLAEVKLHHKWGFIDTTGQMVIEPQFEETRFFQENLAAVRFNGKWGYINREGIMKVEPLYENADFFSEGMAVVRLDGKSGYINQNGVIIIPLQFDAAWNFINELAAIKLNSKWGFTDRSGKIVIAPQYQEVGSFRDELALVRVNDSYGFINRTGQVVIEPQFSRAEDFSEGLAVVQFPDHKFGFIDKSGKVVIEPQFDMAASFNMGCAIVTVFENPGKGAKGWGGCIDRAGNVMQNIRSK